MASLRRAPRHGTPATEPATPAGSPGHSAAATECAPRGYQLWLLVNLVGLGLATLPVLARLWGSLPNNDSWEYAATEWLINSQGGLTRRGLSGDVLLGVPFVTDRVALLATVTLLAIIVPVGFAFLVAWAIRSTKSPWPVLFWLVPAGLVMTTVQASVHGMSTQMTDFAMRKDYLFFAIIIAVVLATLRWPQQRAWRIIAASAAAACAVGVFVHEGVAFVTCGVVTYFLVWLHPNEPRRIRRFPIPAAVALATPTLLALGIVGFIGAAVTPDYKAAWAAVDSATVEWLSVATLQMWGADTGLPNSFWWLNTQVLDGLDWIVRDYIQTGAWLGWLVTTIAVAFCAIAAALLVDHRPSARRRYLAHVGVLALLSLPLYVVAIDWGRWVSFLAISFSVLVLGRFAALGPARAHGDPWRGKLAIAAVLIVVSLALSIPVAGIDFPMARLLS